jgi:8-oxo-dGTP diphosphatase
MSGNAFESGARKAVPAVLIYVKAGDSVLMIHRNTGSRSEERGTAARADYHEGKWNGLGGKLEADESPLEAAMRELREEAGLDLPAEAFHPLGTLTFPNFKAHKSEDWIVFVFVARLDSRPALAGEERGVVHAPEGDLHWIPERDLLSLSLWEGDRHFIPLVAAEKPFVGTIWYEGPRVTRHWIRAL